ncbi:MAG: helix-turn-helix domain-containing protein [Phycisphaerales bacterium]|nr:helix-turn-helix domain-containing protein [Phycisphaerales bacterium]
MTEKICALPAVATQDWCDLAAAALLPVDQAGIAVVVIGQIDEHGVFVKNEATGVAGTYTAEVTTTVGRSQSATNLSSLDANDVSLMRIKTTMAQARELSWGPGVLAPSVAKVTSIDRTHPSASAPTGLLRRWEGVKLGGLVLAAAGIGPDKRVLAAEVGLIGGTTAQLEQMTAAVDAVASSLAKRAIMAIGTELTDGSMWLTVREQIILKHLLLGKSVKDIAEELGRSPHTVHDHVKSLHKKLNAKSRGQLVARALGHVEPIPAAVVVSKTTTGAAEKSGT